MDARRRDRRLDPQAKVQHVDQALDQRRNDAPTTGRTDTQQWLAVAQDDRWRRRPQNPLARSDRVDLPWLRLEPGPAVFQPNARALARHPLAQHTPLPPR